MRAELKRFIAMLLILLVQIQPLQVHAIVLVTEQAGHIPGLLSHSHNDQYDHSILQGEGTQSIGSGVTHLRTKSVHAGECHPAHTLCPMIDWHTGLERNLSGVRVHQAPKLPFYEASLELPPPKFHT